MRARERLVLVGEACDEVREEIRELLEQHGFAVLEACDGHETIVAAHRERPDVVVLDLAMPVIPGVEVALRLRGHPATSRIPIVAYAADAREGAWPGATELAALLPGPPLPHALLASIEHAAGGLPRWLSERRD